jgi:dCTP deaminase
MSILSDSKILERIEVGKITIKPFDRSQLGSNSYDVRIADTLVCYKSDTLDPREEQETTSLIIPDEGMVLKPGKLYLGVTKEFTKTDVDVVMFEGKSSLARLGLLVHITSGFGDVGFKGHITLELTCIQPIKIYKNMKIGQIYYQNVSGLVINPYNKKEDAKYNNDSPVPMPSQMWRNFQQDKIEARKKRIADSGISFDDENLSE